jgi:O-methyltransferase
LTRISYKGLVSILRGWSINHFKSLLKRLARGTGYEIVNLRRPTRSGLPNDFDKADTAAYFRVRPYTQTSAERIFALRRAVEYVVAARLPGSIVECGVWKGGSMMAIAEALLGCGVVDKDLYLFDTFQGMTEPTVDDPAWTHEVWRQQGRAWNAAPLKLVQANLTSTGYPSDRLHYVVGRVEDTLPDTAPATICLLRLDTDFYESTKCELSTLYPRLVSGGVLIIDDYGSFEGSRKATDEFLGTQIKQILLNRIDSDARIAVKP